MQKLLALLLCIVPSLVYGQLPINDNKSSDIKINDFVVGTLLKPAQPSQTLIIIIPGEGAVDRDGNSKMARNNSLKKLAEGLAEQGIATFRYDKRVLTLLKKRALQENKLRFDNFIEDALATVQYFNDRNIFNNIYILGHSQGSLVGIVAAQQSKVKGVISLNGPGQSIDKTIVSQIELQMPDLKENAENAFATLKEKGQVKDYGPALSSIFRKDLQPFMSSWMAYNPRREIRKLKIPTLIIGGTKDLQASVAEAEILKKSKPDAELVIIENMNHLGFEITGDDLENSKSYNETNRPVMPALIETISAFIEN
ncbi:alpha/beta hydrolase [Dokdonia sinensis]|uniref:Alpha/beta hydrolase n=1 Tax=Dokdonia sinensis TaxID=2479847 RepID=A0A3M0GSZ6_9FLAO|nr:alpha/beta fold hydrolase [Dokdonia sinensis]RMB60446.1 alpha/beta hydrolase [Dokdonia sinensis]